MLTRWMMLVRWVNDHDATFFLAVLGLYLAGTALA